MFLCAAPPFLISIFSLQIPADARPDWENRHFISEGECLMKRSPIPAANALARADGLGLRRHAIEKKSPRKGTKTHPYLNTVLTKR